MESLWCLNRREKGSPLTGASILNMAGTTDSLDTKSRSFCRTPGRPRSVKPGDPIRVLLTQMGNFTT